MKQTHGKKIFLDHGFWYFVRNLFLVFLFFFASSSSVAVETELDTKRNQTNWNGVSGRNVWNRKNYDSPNSKPGMQANHVDA